MLKVCIFQYLAGKYEIKRRENRCILGIVDCENSDEAKYECKVTVGDAVTTCTLKCEGNYLCYQDIQTLVPGCAVIKLFSCSAQLSMKFFCS